MRLQWSWSHRVLSIMKNVTFSLSHNSTPLKKAMWYKLCVQHGEVLRGLILPLIRQFSEMQTHPSDIGPGLLHK